jgi:hypothetical protein
LAGTRTLVLKALALVLAKRLPASRRCTHLNGHGGAKYALREVRDHLAANRFVLRTDVKSYYASIDHLMVLDQLAVPIKDRAQPHRPVSAADVRAGRRVLGL